MRVPPLLTPRCWLLLAGALVDLARDAWAEITQNS